MKTGFKIGFLVLVSLSAALVTLCIKQNDQILELEKNQIELDSLRQETFILNIELGRYELTFDHLQETNPKVAKEFEEFMFHETE